MQAKYNGVLRRCYITEEEIPSHEDIANEIGVSAQRLRTVLRSTQPLISIDAPISAGQGAVKGSSAGSDGMGGTNLLLSDTLQW